MSMLAEPRRKQKWTLNPRGKQWSEDSNKFGQKMLEKMGWTSGKGLGANEQGTTEHVRVSVKEDTAGIGFKKDHLDKAWTEHQDGFNDFLQELQKSQSHVVIQKEEVKSELSGKSLELKSKFSRARVHYQKFTRGKDVNKYSLKDLANIFGQKELNISDSIEENQSNCQENSEPNSVGSQENRGGVITINGGNMTDYFMKKYQNFSAIPKNKKREDTNSESEPEYTGFGFVSAVSKEQSRSDKEIKGTKDTCEYAFENPCLTLNSPENICNSNSKVKSKKRKISENSESSNNSKKSKHSDISNSVYENGFINVALDLEGPPNEVCSRKEFEVSRTELGITNSALDLGDEINDKKRVTFNDYVEYNTDSVKKKKERATLDKFEVENKKIKKKKKQEDNLHSNVSSCFVNEALDIEEMSEELHDNKINELKSKSSKKKKENRRSVLETIVEIPEEDKETGENGSKVKKNKQKENILDNFIPEENPSSKKAKKKKKKMEEIVTTCKNNTEKSTKEVDAEVKTAFEKGVELYTQEDQETSCKLEKKKKKNIELSVKKREDVIPRIETEVDNANNIKNNVEKAEVETIKSKKKKKKKIKADVDINDLNTEMVNTKLEKEISDKENANVECEHTPKVKKPKKKKHKESMDESIPDDDNSIHDMESLKEEPIEQVTNASANTPSNTLKNETFSPWSEKAKMSKRHLFRSLFHRNSVAHFPGSNVHEIKGYGVDIQ